MPVCDMCADDSLRDLPIWVQDLIIDSNPDNAYSRYFRAKPQTARCNAPRLVYNSRLGVLQPVYDAEGKVIANPTRR